MEVMKLAIRRLRLIIGAVRANDISLTSTDSVDRAASH